MKWRAWIGAAVALAALSIVGLRVLRRAPRMVYTSEGYGGFVLAPPAKAPAGASAAPSPSPLKDAQDAYRKGQYAKAESAALQAIREGAGRSDPASRRAVVDAREVFAYSAARRKDFAAARERFGDLRVTASSLPDHGTQTAPPGQTAPTIEADAAFQHGVLTAMKDPASGEAEYRKFMQTYPESPLVHAAIQRIGTLHGGHIPKDAEAIWKHAVDTAQQRDRARQREASLCGPECMAELLRRQGTTPDVHALASEMHTNERGTTMQGLAEAADRRGWKAQGLALTPKGLAEQTLPLIALVRPDHYVIVDGVSTEAVSVWDPDRDGCGKGGERQLTAQQWKQAWSGVGLVFGK